MRQPRTQRRWFIPGIALFLLMMMLTPPPASADCDPENCWVCGWTLLGTYCSIANSASGKLCCRDFQGVDFTPACLLSGGACYGIIVRDI